MCYSWLTLSLGAKTSCCAKPFIWLMTLICISRTHFQMNGLFARLVLTQRQNATRKSSFERQWIYSNWYHFNKSLWRVNLQNLFPFVIACNSKLAFKHRFVSCFVSEKWRTCPGVSRVHKINPGLFSTVSWDQDLHISSFLLNHKNYNFLDCDILFSTNSLVKLLSDSLLSGSLLSDSFFIGQFNKPITFKVVV